MKAEKEIKAIDQAIAIMDCLNALGYDTSSLSIVQVFNIKNTLAEVMDGIEGECKSIEDNKTDIYEIISN